MMTHEEALFRFAMRMGDNSLVLGHRLSEWCGHGPQLEEDIAQANIALDLIGQSRNYLTYAGEVEGKGRTEDNLAYQRTDDLWRYTGELFVADEAEELLTNAGVIPDLANLKKEWSATVDRVLNEATLKRPADGWMASGGKNGVHTEHIGPMLAEMQTLQRTYPGAEW